MKLITKYPREKHNNGFYYYYGLFLCPYCDKEVRKRLSAGKTDKSCGCMTSKIISKVNTKHGDGYNSSGLYNIWHQMKKRCYSPNSKRYKDWGGRGITICKQWKESYVKFKFWALNNGYKDGLTIERKNNNGNYEPLNCKWATRKEQVRNKKNNKLTMEKANQIRSLYFNVKITKTLLGKIFNVSGSMICDIVNNKAWV